MLPLILLLIGQRPLGVDVDSGKGTSVLNADIREAVENLAQFISDRLRELCPTSVYACFSGGGIYIYLHHNLFTEKFKTDENSNLSWRILVDCFNAYIKDIESQFFEQHPEYKGKAKADAINNQKRVFKTIFSVHKKYPFAVVPLDVESLKIDIEKSRLPLNTETINAGKGWMNICNAEERKPLILKLKDYEDQCKPFIDDTPHRIKILSKKADEQYWPPCIQKILTLEKVPNGATRMKTFFATFLGQVGYNHEGAQKIFKGISSQLGGPETNIFESWFKKMSCPSCKTIQKKGGGFPHMNMGELEICQPDEICKQVIQPIEYVEKKRIKDATTHPLEVGDNAYQIKFELVGKKIVYTLIRDGEKGLETQSRMNFYKDQDGRRIFYSNILKEIDDKIEGKEEKKKIKSQLHKILIKIQNSGVFDDIAKSKKKQQKETQKNQKKQSKLQELNRYNAKDVIKGIKVDENRIVVHTKNGIFLEKVIGHDKESGDEIWGTECIYNGHVKPLEKMIIDDEFTVHRYIGDMEQIADIPSIIRNMKKSGGVLNKNRFDDCLNAIFLNLPTKKGHATQGVYEEGNELKCCFDCMPIKDMQKKIKMQCELAIKQEITKEALEAYFRTTDFWHDYEVLPSMAMGAIGPFALMLRKKGKLVPTVWNYAPLTRLGKTTVERIFSFYLFAIYPLTGDSVDSKFRLSSAFDGICAYQVIDEADGAEWKHLEGILKDASENYLCNIRGTSDQGVLQYLSRAVLGCNSNRFPIKNEAALVRIFKVEFDTSVADERAGKEHQVELLDDTLGKLTPIGWRLVEIELEDIGYSLDKLLERISNHEKELKKIYKAFFDPRRIFAWATSYEGLKIWELAAIKYGLEWRAPSYADFVEDVVDPIETTTKETGEPPLMDFINWWRMWKVLHIDRVYIGEGENVKEIKGRNEIWADNREVVYRSVYKGDAITTAVLREYQKEGHSKIDTLTEIAKAISLTIGIPEEKLARHWKIGEKTQWGVFIPYSLYEELENIPQPPTQKEVDTDTTGDSDGDYNRECNNGTGEKNHATMRGQQRKQNASAFMEKYHRSTPYEVIHDYILNNMSKGKEEIISELVICDLVEFLSTDEITAMVDRCWNEINTEECNKTNILEDKDNNKLIFTRAEESDIERIIQENPDENYAILSEKYGEDRINKGSEAGILAETILGRKLEFVKRSGGGES